MNSFRWRGASPRRLTVLAIWLMGSCGVAWGQTLTAEEHPPEQRAVTDQPGKDQPAPPAGPAAAMDGFRLARFGMSEEQVRQAVRKDFPGAAMILMNEVAPTEKTTVL